MDIQKLKTALQKATARGRVALIGHDAPDVDSVVSCVLMAALCGGMLGMAGRQCSPLPAMAWPIRGLSG